MSNFVNRWAFASSQSGSDLTREQPPTPLQTPAQSSDADRPLTVLQRTRSATAEELEAVIPDTMDSYSSDSESSAEGEADLEMRLASANTTSRSGRRSTPRVRSTSTEVASDDVVVEEEDDDFEPEPIDMQAFKNECWEELRTAHQDEDPEAEDDENRIIVAVRARPLNKREVDLGTRPCVQMSEGKTVIVRKHKWNSAPSDLNFSYDFAFRQKTHQDEVFAKVGWPSLKNAFHGYNVSVFAYGQTGSGKSHSMLGTEDLPGITRRTGEFMFDFMDRGAKDYGCTYETSVSAVEIYNEHVRDLIMPLVPGMSSPMANKKKKQRSRSLTRGPSFRSSRALSTDSMSVEDMSARGPSLKIRENPKDGVYVEGLSKVEIRSMGELNGIIFAAVENRVVRATNMNADSSRSHLVFTINFSQMRRGKKKRQITTRSKINLIDLAGSERAHTTGMSGEGLREGANINKSLSTLGRVISILASGQNVDHVPYRDSKLTYILKDSLGGNSKTSMLATISPSDANYEETVSTLRYAASVKRIKTAAAANMEWENIGVIENLKIEIEELKARLMVAETEAKVARRRNSGWDAAAALRAKEEATDHNEVLQSLKDELYHSSQACERYKDERDRLQELYDHKVDENERLHAEVTKLHDMMKESGVEYDEIKTRLKSNRGTNAHLSRMSVELASTADENAKLQRKLKEKSEKMKNPLGMMSMVMSSTFFGEDSSEEEQEEQPTEESKEYLGSLSLMGMASAGQWLSAPPGTAAAASPKHRAHATGGKAAAEAPTSGDMHRANNIIESLRAQLDESNTVNQLLEDKVHKQQEKLEEVTSSMLDLKKVQAKLDERVFDSTKQQLEEKERTLRKVRDENRQLLAKMEREKLEFTHTQQELESVKIELDGLQGELQVRQDEYDKVIAQLKNEVNARNLVESELAKLRATMNDLQGKHRDLVRASKDFLADEISARRNRNSIGSPRSPPVSLKDRKSPQQARSLDSAERPSGQQQQQRKGPTPVVTGRRVTVSMDTGATTIPPTQNLISAESILSSLRAANSGELSPETPETPAHLRSAGGGDSGSKRPPSMEPVAEEASQSRDDASEHSVVASSSKRPPAPLESSGRQPPPLARRRSSGRPRTPKTASPLVSPQSSPPPPPPQDLPATATKASPHRSRQPKQQQASPRASPSPSKPGARQSRNSEEVVSPSSPPRSRKSRASDELRASAPPPKASAPPPKASAPPPKASTLPSSEEGSSSPPLKASPPPKRRSRGQLNGSGDAQLSRKDSKKAVKETDVSPLTRKSSKKVMKDGEKTVSRKDSKKAILKEGGGKETPEKEDSVKEQANSDASDATKPIHRNSIKSAFPSVE